MNSYVNISIVGKNPKLFIKRYVLNQIPFEDFKEVSHKHVTIKISYDDYLELLSKNSSYTMVLLLPGISEILLITKNGI